MNFYLSVFKDSKVGTLMGSGAGQEPNKEGTVMFEDFKLLGTWFSAMDGGGSQHTSHSTKRSGSSNVIRRKRLTTTGRSSRRYPSRNSAVGSKINSVFGQITPTAMDAMMASGDSEKIKRVTAAFLKMKKFDIAELERAAQG